MTTTTINLTIIMRRLNYNYFLNHNHNNNNKNKIINYNNYNCNKIHTTTTISSSSTNHTNYKNHVNKIMRLIYSKVHPDLFTNYIQAKKINEDSLKNLRVLIDFAIDSKSKQMSKSRNEEIVFYVKEKDNNLKLRKIEFKLSNKHGLIDDLLNNLVDKLDLPVDKLKSTQQIQPTFNTKIHNFYDNHDDKGININNKTSENATNKKPKEEIIDIRNWFDKNREDITKKYVDYNQLCIQINENKRKLIDKWKLNDIDWQSDWSLRNYNSYLIALRSINLHNSQQYLSQLSGLNLLLTNNFIGLNRYGYICVKVDLVIEQWLQILINAKNELFMLREIHEMESVLKNILFKINLSNLMFDNDKKSHFNPASNYYKTLNIILNRFSATHFDYANENYDFSKLHLVVNDESYCSVEMNDIGQFVIGKSVSDFKQVVEFISSKQQTSSDRLKEYFKSKEQLNDLNGKIINKYKLKSLNYNKRLNKESVDSCLNNLLANNYAINLNDINLVIGFNYFLNDDSSVEIPWDFNII